MTPQSLSPRRNHALRALFGLALVASLTACDLFAGGPPDKLSPEQQVRVDALVKKTLQHMSFVPAGGFWLGDPGVLMTDELKASGAVLGPDVTISGNPGYTIGEDNKPPRWVTLDAFSIGQYKVTYGDFDVYVEANGLPAHPPEGDAETYKVIWHKARQSDEIPAGVSWQQAKDYCLWMGKESSLPFDLPSEAQWEFAASNGRKTHREPMPTDNGLLDQGRNLPTFDQKKELIGRGILYPVGRFPPSKLGLYDLVTNGYDWVNDWYAPNAYQTMVETHNPKGPASGTEKGMRGHVPNSDISFTGFPHVDRYHEIPTGLKFQGETWHYSRNSFRCVINNHEAVTPTQ